MQDAWSDIVFRQTLQLMVEGVGEAVGFEVAAISVLTVDRGWELAAFVGEPASPEFELPALSTPEALAEELKGAEAWGDWRFVPDPDPPDGHRSDRQDSAAQDSPAWHPRDRLIAPISDTQGQLRAVLQVAQPTDGQRPAAAKRDRLQLYADHTRRVALTMVKREEAERRRELAEQARRAVRDATGEFGAKAVVDAVGPAFMDAFNASRLFIEVVEDDVAGPNPSWLGGDQAWQPSELALTTTRAVARACWEDQRVGVLRRAEQADGLLPPEELARVLEALNRAGPAGMMVVPVGVGSVFMGYLITVGHRRDEPWTAAELDTALDLGHDLGRAILTGRVLTRERDVAEKLRRLDGYRRTFVRTLAHELKNPLAAIFGHTAMTSQLPLSAQAAESMSAIRTAADRMRILIDDLLVLSGLNDPEFALVPARIDLVQLVAEVVEANRVLAQQRQLVLEHETPLTLKFGGSYTELERALTNLVSNAINYTPPGGRVVVSLSEEPDEIRISVRDNGPGILAEDRRRLFDDFYRGAHPATRGVPGSGLGLSIVSHVAARHGGHVDVDSAVGEGADFTLVLPAPEPGTWADGARSEEPTEPRE